MKIKVFIKPNSKSLPRIIKADAFWTIFVKSPPIDGQANREAVEIIAADLKLSKSAIKLKSGASARYKIFEIKN